MTATYNSTTPKIVGAMVILAVTASGAYFFILRDIKPEQSRSSLPTATSTTATVSQPAAATTSVNTPASTASTSGYKDGTYTATASYYVPHGQNNISVTIVIKEGVVSSVTPTHDYQDHESQMYVSSFDDYISGKVVGKNISTLTSLSRVGGASLTTEGFDQAIQTIAAQAKA
jgi:uncharacterized protein with FMN-binding domain